LKTVSVGAKRVYCLIMGHAEMSDAQETERINPFHPIRGHHTKRKKSYACDSRIADALDERVGLNSTSVVFPMGMCQSPVGRQNVRCGDAKCS
jgi:hypothetical protein